MMKVFDIVSNGEGRGRVGMPELVVGVAATIEEGGIDDVVAAKE